MTYFSLCMPLCYVCLELLLALLGFSSVLEYILQGFNETCKVLFELKHKLMNISNSECDDTCMRDAWVRCVDETKWAMGWTVRLYQVLNWS